jgi:hypothetical protein
MNLSMFDRFCPSLKTRVLIDKRRFDMSRSDKNSEKYVIPMHRKDIWTNKCMHDPRNIFLQVATMIIVHCIGKVGDHLNERED